MFVQPLLGLRCASSAFSSVMARLLKRIQNNYVAQAARVWLRCALATSISSALFLTASSAAADESPAVRPPAVSGSFYPADSEELTETVDRLLQAAPIHPVSGQLIGVVVPHAGYQYSGAVAAAAFKQLQGKSFRTVILVGPSHRHRFDGFAVLHRGAMATPLGEVLIDEQMGLRLFERSDAFRTDWVVHAQEHSLEVELPFLQRVLGSFRVVPILAGSDDPSDAIRLADALLPLLTDETLLVVSVDLSHYHPYDAAVALDRRAIDTVASGDEDGFVELLRAGQAEVDAPVPLLAMMHIAERLGATVQELAYRNSGDVTGDRRRVVGYVAMAMTRPMEAEGGAGGELSAEARQALLQLARRSIEAAVQREPLPSLPGGPPVLSEPRGAFVTIKRQQRLRGCIGYTQPIGPLAEVVQKVAVAAALDDPRFRPVVPSELSELDLEISVLSMPELLSDPSQIAVGRHGLIIQKGSMSGLLLPQVATEYGWDRETFLAEVSRKAGLAPTAWKERDAKLYTFTAEVFHE